MSAAIGAAGDRGAHYIATCGLRTYKEQDALYAIGRTTGTPGHIVTKARGGFGPHNFGVAVDFCRDADENWGQKGLKPDYRDKQYVVLAEESRKLGLEPGYYWDFQDSPHVQLPLKKHGVSWAMLREAYAKGQMKAVFALLDKHGPWK